MKKMRVFSVILACLTLIATGLVLAACKEEEPEKAASQTPSCDHVWDWLETKTPTATEAGEETYTCLLCGQTGIKRAKSAIQTPIASVTISITAPVNGVTPSATASTTDTTYTLSAVTWSPADNEFHGGTVYTASVTLTADSGYTFTGLSSATVNGQGVTLSNKTSSAVTLSYIFPATDTKRVTGMAIKTQPAKLTYTHGDSLDLTGLVVTMTHDDTTTEDVSAVNFASKNITVNPVQGDSLVYPTHNGQPVTVTFGNLTPLATNNLTVNPKTIANVEISVTAPVKSSSPVTTANGTGDFTISPAAWSPADDPFHGGEVYTVTFTLTADSGYTFSGLSSATINGQSAAVSNNTGTAVTLSYTFPETNTKTVTGMAIKTQPAKLTYTHGDPLDLTGLAVTMTYDDTTAEDVPASDFASKNITAGPANGDNLVRLTHNGKPVTITYGELTLTANNLTVNAKAVSSLTYDPTSFSAQTYNGNPHTPAVTVKDGSTTLAPTTDYTIAYANNTNAGTATVTITGAGNYTGSRNMTFAINKAAGAALNAPTAATIGVNSVTLNAVSASTGQTVEYARNSTNTAPSSGWQTGTTFNSLTAGTTYYFFARSVGNSNYNLGEASASLTVTIRTVTFNANSGSGTVPSNQYANNNTSITLPPQGNLARTNYTFGGWNTNTEGTGTNYNASSSYTVTGNITLYAKWIPVQYTVTFNANGAAGTVPAAQTTDYNANITLPNASGLTKSGYIFGGWSANTAGTGTNYNANSSYTVTGNVTLYAVWNFNVSGNSLADKLAWLQTNAQSNESYILQVNANESIAPHTLSYSDRSNITITIAGVGANRTINLSSNGAMFSVYSGVTLVLDNNIILRGRSDNNGSTVYVNSNGTFIMNGGTISGNTYAGGEGGGVSWSGYGGGVFVDGTFIMNGGTISGNTAGGFDGEGGGVVVNRNATFIMNGGTISGNTAGGYGGGGVSIRSGSSTGTFVDGTFTMNGGTISGNSADASAYQQRFSHGGGVYLRGTFTMNSGTISGNSANGENGRGFGGGVYVSALSYVGSLFIMNGGTISGNSSGNGNGDGGGVYVAGQYRDSNTVAGTFRMVTGTIYGYGEGALRNSPDALYVQENYYSGTAQRGTFSGSTWINRGTLPSTFETIRVVNGVLVQ
jgi:uncharacterized repeat protein (TIGR02543 family)